MIHFSRPWTHIPDAPPPSAQSPQGSDVFGEEVTLAEKTIIYMTGNATWDSAFETLIDAFKQLNTVMDRQGLKSNRVLPNVASSASAWPIAAECLKPWPEHGDAMITRGDSG